ncbi:MAG: DUF4136 domain-containing protein [Gammaproteobacteria bacterium]
MKPIRLFSLLTLLLVLAGCASTVGVEIERNASFSNLNRFAWLPPGRQPIKNPIINSGIITQRVKRASIEVLQNRGFSYRKKPAQAQFLITYHIISHREFVNNQPFFPGVGFGFPYYDDYFYPGAAMMVGGFGFGYGYGNAYSYRKADLILDIISAKNRHLIWRGWESQIVTRSNFSMRAIYHLVNHILQHFPPR